MNKVTRACLLVGTLLALVGLVAAQANRSRTGLQPGGRNAGVEHEHFDLDDVHGRYVSAENAADTSSVHAFSAPDGSLVGPPIPFATVEVMVADGRGNICGESDGFYSGISAPGVNLGPSLYHGTYTVDPADGRVTILTCSDGAPTTTNKFCATSTPCASVTKAQVGYLQAAHTSKIVTVEQTGFGTDPDSSGFLVHKRVWTTSGEPEHD